MSDLSNFLSGANSKLKKAPKPKRSELEKFKTKDFSDIIKGGSGGGGLLSGLGGLAGSIIGGKAIKGVKGLFDKKVGKEVAQQATDKLGKSVTKQVGKEAVEATTKEVGKKTLEKGAAKIIGKKIPVIGAALGTVFAVERAMRGDWLGATGELASGIASTIPGAGTAVSLGIDAALIAKDVKSAETSGKQPDKKTKDKPVVKPANASIAQQSDIKTKQRMGTMVPGAAAAGDQMLDTKTFQRVVEMFGQLVNMGILSGQATHDEGSPEADEGGNDDPPVTDPYNGPIDGNQFWPLPGGVLSNRSNGYPGGEYGASRNYGGHSGQDIGGKDAGSPVVAWKTGKVSFTGSVEAGDTIITIDHGGGVQSVYKHVVPTVQSGTTVYGGQQVATLFNSRAYAPHLHFEVWRNGSHTNPNGDLSSSQKIPSPLDQSKAKQHYEQNQTNATGAPKNDAGGLQYTGASAAKSTVIGDSIAKGLANQMGVSGQYTKESRDVKAVRQAAELAAASGDVGGKNIVLSSGISNNTSQLSEVRSLIQYLKDQGAAGIQLAGTSNDRTDLKKMNPKLAALAREFGTFVQFGGGFSAADQIHPNYAQYSQQLKQLKSAAYNQQAQQAVSNIYRVNNTNNTTLLIPQAPQPQPQIGAGGGGMTLMPVPLVDVAPSPLHVVLGQK